MGKTGTKMMISLEPDTKVDDVYTECVDVSETGTIMHIGMVHSIPPGNSEVIHVDSDENDGDSSSRRG